MNKLSENLSPYSQILLRYRKNLAVGDKQALAACMEEIESRLKNIAEDSALTIDVNIILDELITNIFMHGFKDKDGEGEAVVVNLIVTDSQIIIRLRDRGEAFDPNKHIPKLPESDDIHDLQLGGLGIFMVRERVGRYDYIYRRGWNIQTLTKELPKQLPESFYHNKYQQRAHCINDANENALAEMMEKKTPESLDWKDWRNITERLAKKQQIDNYRDYRIPLTVDAGLQRGAYKLGEDYRVEIHACSWGNRNNPPLICFGGILNTAHRFVLLARALAEDYFTVGVSWAGRGSSDWLVEQDDYNLDVYAAHIDAVMNYFGFGEVTLLGSSLGGSAALHYLGGERYTHQAGKIKRLILNDTGFVIPATRRARRSVKVGRHYHFRTPQDLLRRYELANRGEGTIPESFLLLYAHWQTRPLNEFAYGYSHDYRALAAYRREACDDLDLSVQWQAVGNLPILLLHGENSTALTEEMCLQMSQDKPNLRLLDVKGVGHTPPLTDEKIIGSIGAWMQNHHDENITQKQTHEQQLIRPRKFRHDKIFIFNEAEKKTSAVTDTPLVQDFFVVRHGMTDFNQKGIRCGSDHDVPLNRIGVAEAIRYGIFFKKTFAKTGEAAYNRIYCGGLQRILKTAHIIGTICGVHDIYSDDAFNERWLGEYSGMAKALYEYEIMRQIAPKAGESEEAFCTRVQSAINIVTHHAAVTPIVVTSRGVIIRMLRHLTQDYDDQLTTRNIIYRFIYNTAKGSWSVNKIDASAIAVKESEYDNLFRQLQSQESHAEAI